MKNLSKVDAPVGAVKKFEADTNMVTIRKPCGLQVAEARQTEAVQNDIDAGMCVAG